MGWRDAFVKSLAGLGSTALLSSSSASTVLRGIGLGLALMSLTGCANTLASNENKDVACAASLLLVESGHGEADGSRGFSDTGAGGVSDDGAAHNGTYDAAHGAHYDTDSDGVSDGTERGQLWLDGKRFDLNRLAHMHVQGCQPATVLEGLDTGNAAVRVQIADALVGAGQFELAVAWYKKAESLVAYERLLELHSTTGPLVDDALYLRYEIERAQLQQAFGQQIDWPAVGHAQPLFVQSRRTALYHDTDFDSPVLEALDEDEQVYLLDVVMLEDTESYWVQAYYPTTLALGWIPAQDMAQYPRRVRDALAELDTAASRNYAQQLLFTALLHGMDKSELIALSENDFFAGAVRQQQNSAAIIRRLNHVADACQSEAADLEQSYARYLMGEGPMPQATDASDTFAMREALAALTGRPAPGIAVDEHLAEQLSQQAYHYVRIRSFGQFEQRLCHSLPNAAGSPEYAETTCEALATLQHCINRVDAILTPR